MPGSLKCTPLVIVTVILATVTTYASTAIIQPTSGGNGTVANSVALSGFAQTCSSWSGFFGNNANGMGVAVLVASCSTTTGGSKDSILDLNTCFANDDGHLNCRKK